MIKLPEVEKTKSLARLGKKLLGSLGIWGSALLSLGLIQGATPAQPRANTSEATVTSTSNRVAPALVLQSPDSRTAPGDAALARHHSHVSHHSHASHSSHASHYSHYSGSI
jgi:hypothetical protein